MKKNNMLRIASVLLVAVLLSTCAISGAFAKYTTSGSASDEARVAAFGFEVKVTGGEAFSTMYKDEAVDSKDAATVVSATTEKVVAPGTEGTLATFAIDGTAEVDVTITTKATLELNNWVVGESKVYCPIVITVGDSTYDFSEITTSDDMATEIANVVASIEGEVETVKAGNESAKEGFAVSWKWAYELNVNDIEDEADKAAAIAARDAKDTALAKAETPAMIVLDITTTITQID